VKTSPNALKGIALVVLAMAIMPFIDVCAKFLGQQQFPVPQTVWGRFFFGALFTLPFALRVAGKSAFKFDNLGLNGARALFLVSGTAFFFWALKTLPIADTLAIFFVQPILITAFSPIFLGEHVGVRRWVTVFIGFIGVLVIIRPGLQAFNIGVLYALGAGTCSACYYLVTRKMAGRADAMVTTFQTSVIAAAALSLAVPFVWTAPSGEQWILLVLLGGIAIAGHFCVTRAYDFAEASLLSPFNYTEMIVAVAVGWWFFNDFPDHWTFVGVAILIACAIYISLRERSLSRASATAGTQI
jgi:drug/metabolite transporter (DMT)-like permease